MAIWFFTSPVAFGNAVFQTLKLWMTCALPLYLPEGSDVSASSAYGACAYSPLTISLTHCLNVAMFAAVFALLSWIVVGFAFRSVIRDLLFFGLNHNRLFPNFK